MDESSLETLTPQHEKDASAGYYVPPTDIYETPETLMLVMEMPGVEKRDLAVTLENDVLKIEGRIDFRKYQDLEPVCTEYNVGHYSRSFTLGTGVDRNKISAQLNDRVLTLTLQKSETARPRRIDIEG